MIPSTLLTVVLPVVHTISTLLEMPLTPTAVHCRVVDCPSVGMFSVVTTTTGDGTVQKEFLLNAFINLYLHKTYLSTVGEGYNILITCK